MEKVEKEHSYLHILKYAGIFGGVQGANIFISLVRNKCLALLLGPSGMGLISLFNSTIGLLANVSNLGLPVSGVKTISEKLESGHEAEVFETVNLIRSWSVLAALLGMLLCIVCSPLLDKFTFTWGNHVLHFVLLSPVVAMTVLAGGELAVLKALRQLKALALVSLYTMLASLFVSVPVFYFWGQRGIVPVLLLQVFFQLLLVLFWSYRKVPLQLSFSTSVLAGGRTIVNLGLAFVAAGVFNSAAEFFMRSFLSRTAGLEVVGLFNAACSLVLLYSGVIFASLETDYFPRLSAVGKNDRLKMNTCVNRQIEVNILLIGPLACLLVWALPFLIPVLYNSKFLGMLSLAQWTTMALLFRAVYLPIEYLPLTQGASRVYLCQEALSVLLLFVAQIIGFLCAGLPGMGIGMLIAYLLEMLGVIIYNRHYFSFRLSTPAWIYLLVEVFFGGLMAMLVVCFECQGWLYWLMGFAISLFCFVFSFSRLKKGMSVHLDFLSRFFKQ